MSDYIIQIIIGILISGSFAFAARYMSKLVKRIDDFGKYLPEIIAANNLIAQQQTALVSANRNFTRSLRSVCFSMKEAGMNGSLKYAFVHLDNAENDINGKQSVAAQVAMTLEGCE